MKITTENNIKQFILNRINRVYIKFSDDVEIKLDKIIDYDLDIDSNDISTIELTSAMQDCEIINRFNDKKKNRITFIHIEGISCSSDECSVDAFYDIRCIMKIRKLRINNNDCCANMFIELEGIVG